MIEILQSQPLLLIGVVIVLGFYLGGIARKTRLPSLIGFMVLGVLFGPSFFGVFNAQNLEGLSFITEMALGFVAFSIGAELRIMSLRQMGRGIVSIILAESFGAFILVTLVVYLLTRNLPLALLFGGVAPASAPAGTVAVIQENRARGSLTRALYAVVGFDDGLAILIFGFAAALAKVLIVKQLLGGDGASLNILAAMGRPALEIVGSLAVGTVLGFVFCQLVRRLRSGRDMLIIIFGTVLAATGISLFLNLSLILTNMAIGFVLVNTRREAFVHKVTAPLREIMPLLFILFFCLAGAHLEIGELPKLGIAGLLYIIARSTGLIVGSRLGALVGHVEEKIRKWIGLGILSQAGVAIGLSLIISHELREMAARPDIAQAVSRYASAHPGVNPVVYDPAAIGAAIITIITATCIVFEIIGPILTKIALQHAGEIGQDKRGE
ncbi:cation:proton antiporter [bacterium]|nr:cation:proton antiporter [bacterium]